MPDRDPWPLTAMSLRELARLRATINPDRFNSCVQEDLARLFQALEAYIERYGPYPTLTITSQELRAMSPEEMDRAALRMVAVARDIRYEPPPGPEQTIACDFDGVLHSYVSPWAGAAVVADPPVPGAIEWIVATTARYKIAITSTRNSQPGGVLAMYEWLRDNGLPRDAMSRIYFPLHKPQAIVYLDDRAMRFTGSWPTVADLNAARPWNRKG